MAKKRAKRAKKAKRASLFEEGKRVLDAWAEQPGKPDDVPTKEQPAAKTSRRPKVERRKVTLWLDADAIYRLGMTTVELQHQYDLPASVATLSHVVSALLHMHSEDLPELAREIGKGEGADIP